MAQNIILNVTPDTLIAKAEEMETQRAVLAGLLEEAKNDINGLATQEIWVSDASSTYQSKFNASYDELTEILKVVQEYTADLNKAAEFYQQGEQAAQSAAEGLPTSGIFNV